MGTVRVGVTIGTDNVLTTPVTISSGKSFTADSGSVTRVKLAPVATDPSNPIIYKATDKLDRTYLYVRNLATELEKFVYLWVDGSSEDIVIAKLGGGEFTFIPVPSDKTFRAYGTDVDQLIEYAVFGLDNSSTTLG